MDIDLDGFRYDNSVHIIIEAKDEMEMNFNFKWSGGDTLEVTRDLWANESDEITMGQWSMAKHCKTPLAYIKLTCMCYCLEQQADLAYDRGDERTATLLETQMNVIENELDIMVGAIERQETAQ